MDIYRLHKTKIYQFFKRLFFIPIYFLNKIKGTEDYFVKWVYDNGENQYKTNYPLDSDSIVVDVGGYKGYFSDRIVALYNPKIVIFEPVKEYYSYLKKRYKNNNKVQVLNCGLSDKSSKQKIYLSGDSSSLFKRSSKTEEVVLKEAANILKKYNTIDLMSINIEGAEYQLLDHLIKTGIIKKINFLQVQFHQFIPNSKNLRRLLIRKILKTHGIGYSYPYVWESFELKY